MPIDRTSPFSWLGDLRVRSASKSKAGGKAGEKGAPTNAKAPTANAPLRDMAALRQSVAAIFNDMDTDDADAVLARREPVLRTIMLWEFGSDFRGDPQFLPMIDELSRAIEHNADLQGRFTAMVGALRSR